MIIIKKEHVTPHGGWRMVCPHCQLALHASSLQALRTITFRHYEANSLTISETDFRQAVCAATPYAICEERTLAGDIVAKVAQPIAGAIDRVTRAIGKPTSVKKCGGCARRREKLNMMHQRLIGAGT